MGDITKPQSIWEEFLSWVETTSLFNALKNVPKGSDFYEIRTNNPEMAFNINLSATKINQALDLPKEVLRVFYINSPYYKTREEQEIITSVHDSEIIELFINKHQKQLPNAN